MQSDLKDMNSNQIINSLDDLLAQGHTINEIVSELDSAITIANYELLVRKGATNIDLGKLRDSVDARVVMNNLSVFQRANVPVDKEGIIELIHAFSQAPLIERVLPQEIEAWVRLGADPKVIADGYIHNFGSKPVILETLINLGAKLNTDELIKHFLLIVKKFKTDEDLEDIIKILRLAGVSDDSIDELRKRTSELIR
jgi:hypothetical protein